MKFYILLISLFFFSCSENIKSVKDDNKPNNASSLSIPESGTLKEDIPKASEWLVNYFSKDSIILDYSLQSIKKLDDFIEKNSENGNPKINSELSQDLGYKLFAIGSYVGQVIIKNVPGSKWVTDDNDPNGEVNIEIVTKNDGHMWPAQKVLKRYKNGSEDELYGYAFITIKDFSK